MKLKIDEDEFLVREGTSFKLKDHPTRLEKAVYENKQDYLERLAEYQSEIDDLQSMMYAHDRYSVLLIFQAMDAAGKDGTIKRVMSGVNPHGVKIHAFKQPSKEELDHDFLWRTTRKLPPRGTIGIFNRSYYEEVLVCRVHPEIVSEHQRLPVPLTQNLKKVWKARYRSIREFEQHATSNGTIVLKFFLNVSKEEQRQRFLDRLREPEKHWKFSGADVRERQYWKEYMKAYEVCIQETATEQAPWYVIPADDKRSMRLIVSRVVLKRLEDLDLHYPIVGEERKAKLGEYRAKLENED